MASKAEDKGRLPGVDDDVCWLPIPNFVGLYEVSRCARVRSLDRLVEKRNRWGQRVNFRQHGCELQPYITASGRPQVVLHDAAGRRHSRNVNHLVTEAFGLGAADND